MRPLVCEVSLGEMLAFSLSRSWGTQKLRRLAELERHVVVVHISDPGVRQAYAELSTLAQSSGWSLFHGKNVGIGRRSVPPTWWCPRRSGHQQRYRGVSDHPK